MATCLIMESRSNDSFPMIIRNSTQRSYRRQNNQSKRIINKSGQLNVQPAQVPLKYLRFTRDFANTLVSIRWRWLILFVILINAFFYVVFSGIWMLDAYVSGDFAAGKTSDFCIHHSRNYTGYLLLSIETITTTGYGYHFPTENCDLVVLILTLNTLIVIFLDGGFISLVYLKFCKPQTRDSRRIFSKKAVICLRNGKLCLIFRVYDHFNKHMIKTVISAYYVDKNNINDSSLHLEELALNTVGVLVWPVDIVHEIDENSPLYRIGAHELFRNKFEIVVSLSGSSAITSQNSISKTSYLNEEILWGYRYQNCIEFDDKNKEYRINHERMFKVTPCDTSLCSAEKLNLIRSELVN